MVRIFLPLLAATAFAQSHWPLQLETDVNTQSWQAAVRVGIAIVEEIDAGRMFTRMEDVGAEIRIRNLYAQALDHTGNSSEAKRQRSLARQLAADPGPRRIANLKSEILATEVREPADLPRSSGALVVAFWADWCALCKSELDQLAKYRHPRAEIVTFDVDHLDPSLRRYVPKQSLQSSDLPQLYIVDPHGNIRFHIAGFENDGLFANKLDWMIEAALRD